MMSSPQAPTPTRRYGPLAMLLLAASPSESLVPLPMHTHQPSQRHAPPPHGPASWVRSACRRPRVSVELGSTATPVDSTSDTAADDDDSSPSASMREEWRPCLRDGAEAIDGSIDDLVDLLTEIRSQPFFRLYSVDLLASCAYMPQEIDECETQSCDLYPVDEEDVPSKILKVDTAEYGFELDGWVRWDMPTEDYYDAVSNPEAYTAYDGSLIWKFIHEKICFQKDLNTELWKLDFNRAVSGLHSSISAHIVEGMVYADEDAPAVDGSELDPMAEYKRRLSPHGQNPDAIGNLYYGTMLLLCAVREARGRLGAYDYGTDMMGSGDVGELMEELLESPLLSDSSLVAKIDQAQDNLRDHVASNPMSLWKARLRTRDLLRIMNCVQCNVCRLHGKVGALGLSVAMSILLGDEGRGGDAGRLHRVEIAALVSTLGKFANAIQIVGEMEERTAMAGE